MQTLPLPMPLIYREDSASSSYSRNESRPMSAEDVFYSLYEQRLPVAGDFMSFSEATDATLLSSLSTLAIDVDLDTFSALRDGLQWGFRSHAMGGGNDDDEVDMRFMEERRRAIIDQVIDAFSVVRQPSEEFDDDEDVSLQAGRVLTITNDAAAEEANFLNQMVSFDQDLVSFDQDYIAALTRDPVAAQDARIWSESDNDDNEGLWSESDDEDDNDDFAYEETLRRFVQNQGISDEDYRIWTEIMREEFRERAAAETEIPQTLTPEERDTAIQQTRLALDDEEVCCVCLRNFPNASFEGCHRVTTTSGICCFLCAEMVRSRRMNCPHCRAVITGVRVVWEK